MTKGLSGAKDLNGFLCDVSTLSKIKYISFIVDQGAAGFAYLFLLAERTNIAQETVQHLNLSSNYSVT
jgi:hypothetical protein